MLYIQFILFGLISTTSAEFSLPVNMDFEIHYYNYSNCSSQFKVNKFSDYCTNYENNNGTRKCCQDALNSLDVFGDLKFNRCYMGEINNKTFYVKYECSTNKLKSLTITQILALIGVTLLAIIFIIFLISLLKFLCCKNIEKDYTRLN